MSRQTKYEILTGIMRRELLHAVFRFRKPVNFLEPNRVLLRFAHEEIEGRLLHRVSLYKTVTGPAKPGLL
jgi:hypothetical protein